MYDVEVSMTRIKLESPQFSETTRWELCKGPFPKATGIYMYIYIYTYIYIYKDAWMCRDVS